MPSKVSCYLVHFNTVVAASYDVAEGRSRRCRRTDAAPVTLRYIFREETLKLYFSQFGALEAAEVMKDRYTGKSRGFGFVSFLDPGAATRALAVEHTIDGRRCEAKIALPKVRCAN